MAARGSRFVAQGKQWPPRPSHAPYPFLIESGCCLYCSAVYIVLVAICFHTFGSRSSPRSINSESCDEPLPVFISLEIVLTCLAFAAEVSSITWWVSRIIWRKRMICSFRTSYLRQTTVRLLNQDGLISVSEARPASMCKVSFGVVDNHCDAAVFD